MASLLPVENPYSFVAESAPSYTDTRNLKDDSAVERFVQDVRRAVDEINAVALKKISGLHDALEHLEKTPEDFRSLGKDGDVGTRIKRIEKSEREEKKARAFISSSQKKLTGTDQILVRKMQEADENLYDIISLLQELRWRIMILDSKEQPGSETVYSSAREALDAFRS